MNDKGDMNTATEIGTCEVMTLFAEQKSQQMNCYSLNLLLFSVGDVYFGVDAEQIAGIAVYNGELSDDLFWFHNELSFGNKEITYCSPTVITIRMKNKLPYRVIIDAMEDISEFSQSDIRLFPELLEPFAMRCGLWGVLPRKERMVLLLDMKLLLKQKRSEIN